MNYVYERNVAMTTRDNTRLVADIWRPIAGAAPTILLRTPYDKQAVATFGSPTSMMPSLFPLINAGYALVIQDVRGTGQSDGVFEPKVNEIADGQDTVAWTIQQDWSNGSVVMLGGSYHGMVQWALAISDTPGLRAIAPATASTNWYADLWYSNGGAMSLSLDTLWNAQMYAGQEQRSLVRGESQDPTHLMRLGGALIDPLALNEPTPLADLPVHGRGRWFDVWIDHPDFDGYWQDQDWSGTDFASRVTVPTLSIGGWYDLKINGTVNGFTSVRENGATEPAREQSRLIIGPWDHLGVTGRYQDRNFGILAARDLAADHIAFFNEHASDQAPAQPAPRVQIFVMGIDQWRDEQDWPLPDTEYTDLYLHSLGSAATRDGDGVLLREEPTEDSIDEFIYDPRNPVPTAGGALLPDLPGLVGPVDQASVDGRADVLCYTTGAFSEPLEVTGRVTLTVSVSSSALDTDVTAKLVDVFPDGRAFNLCDGVLRLRYRDSLSEPRNLNPGETYEVTIDMGVTSNVFLPGHRLRLDITSSNFPRFDRNTNTGGTISRERVEDSVIATNRVHHGPSALSRLTLPIINR